MINRSKPTRILVLDADQVAALAVVRSLVRQRYLVDVASAVANPIASYSRRVATRWQYPDPLTAEDAFLQWMEEHLAKARYDLVIPVTERSLVPLSAHRERFASGQFPIAQQDSLNRVLDKAETFRLAETLGVAAPRSIHITHIGQLEQYLEQIAFPVVIKPSHSVSASGGDKGYSKRNVSYARNETELRAQCEQCLQHSTVLLQSFFQGIGAGIELIARNGEILYSFQHVRLHEVPLTGGGSSFRVSTPVDPTLLEASKRLVGALNWNGVAMVEFKWDPGTGRYSLMEINGRLWGSLPLAVAAGADFPAMMVELALHGQLGDYPPYRSGIYCRNLGRDLMWHEMVLRTGDADRDSFAGLVQFPTRREMLRDLVRMLSPRHRFDTQSLRDPLPGFVEIGRLGAQYWRRVVDVVAEKRFAGQQCRMWRNGTVRQRLLGARSILFICYGNINRSALADVVLRQTLPPAAGKQICSAGFHSEEGRPADHRMQAVAAAGGFDLSGCLSKRVTKQVLHESDIIFVMEKQHRDRVVAIDPSVADRVFLLGPGSRDQGRGAAEIPDPYNRSEADYRACFTQIQAAAGRLAGFVRTESAEP